MTTSRLSYLLLVLLDLVIFTTAVVAYSSEQEECVYTVYVETGDVEKAGTDSKITLTLSDYSGQSVSIGNLREWGLMGPRHDYFERGNVDIFSGRTRCLGSSICKLSLASDGKGILPAWFVETIEVTFTGFHKQCSQAVFFLSRWLSPEPHGELSLDVDMCSFPYLSRPWSAGPNYKEGREGRPSVVGKAKPLISFASASV